MDPLEGKLYLLLTLVQSLSYDTPSLRFGALRQRNCRSCALSLAVPSGYADRVSRFGRTMKTISSRGYASKPHFVNPISYQKP